jgi:hypothetical protein
MAMLISNDSGFGGAEWEPYSSRRSWFLLNAGGAGSEMMRTVYVRYRSGSESPATATVQDDIIVDDIPPTGTVAVSASGTRLTLSATDDVSGVNDMAVSATLQFVGSTWEPFTTTRDWSGGVPFVKFRDRAGNVSRTITPSATQPPNGPFGAFESPAEGATVHGSLALGGWALADAGVTRVRIYRDAVYPENSQLVFLGDAVFVDGARPDVANLFSTLPSSTRAGWGLLVLTSMLPDGGNGPVTFYAFADAADGRMALLGRRTVIVDNARSPSPFGTIDTPAQGATVGGSAYVNFGWALTPQPKRIPTDGSTINVYVDGQFVGHPTYNLRRDDVAALFRTLANADGAVGYFMLDTTRYADGLHTISWTVVDDAGVAEGIGSRYFRVQNSPGSNAAPSEALAIAVPPESGLSAGEPCTPGRRVGNDPNVEWRRLDGDRPAIMTSGERVELRICARIDSAHLLQDGVRQPLPVGASSARGRTFAWDPGPAFLGEFELEFEFSATSGEPPRRVNVTIAR